MQVTILSAQLGLDSELVEWYRDATSVAFGLLLIDFSPRTDDRLRFCTNSGSVPPDFYTHERLNHLRTLDDEYTKLLYSSNVPITFRKWKNHFLQSCPKELIWFLCECIVNLLKGNLKTIKRHHVAKFQDEVWLISLKRTTWKQKKKRSVVKARIATNSSHYTSRH